jgi:hypothetical protein
MTDNAQDEGFEFDEIDEIADELDNGWEPSDHGISVGDYKKMFKENHPTSSQWKNGTDSKSDDVFVTVDEGSSVMWKQFQVESDFVRKKVTSILNNSSPSINDLFNLVFGPRSK